MSAIAYQSMIFYIESVEKIVDPTYKNMNIFHICYVFHVFSYLSSFQNQKMLK